MIHGIKNAFENIKRDCETKLNDLFPHGVPEAVRVRYETEMGYLERSEYVDDFEILRLFSKEVRRCSSHFGIRGTLPGSFLCYLLGESRFDPLNPYYYCQECGHYEEVGGHLFGIDLPPKKCPVCGAEVYADGYRISIESVWGTDGKKPIHIEYEVGEDFFPYARRVLQELYPQNAIVPFGMYGRNKDDIEHIRINRMGFAVLPQGTCVNDYSDLAAYLEDGEECLSGSGWAVDQHGIFCVRMYPNNLVSTLLEMQRKTGRYIEDISRENIREITWKNVMNCTLLRQSQFRLFHEIQPRSITGMERILASTFATFSCAERKKSGEENWEELLELMNHEDWKTYPCFTREDYFEYLVEYGMGREDAFQLSEKIRKGRIYRHPEVLDSYDMPEEIKRMAQQCLYCFPKAHCVEKLMQYLRLAYYAKTDCRMYSKVVYAKNKKQTDYYMAP